MTILKRGRLTTRAALLGLAGLAMIGASSVAARVGVTSATDGEPIGKPPQAVERVLHVGIDVQANELIRTKADDRAQLLFIDGTTLTVGPNAELTIDKFVYDPATRKGELSINASKGVLRLVGGKISKSAPIVVTTPAGTMGVRGGIALLEVKTYSTPPNTTAAAVGQPGGVPSQLTAVFVFGECMDVAGAGVVEKVCQPGYQVIVETGGAPSKGSVADSAILANLIGVLTGKGNNASVAALAGALTKAGVTNAAVLASILGALGTTQSLSGPINAPLTTLLATVNQAQNSNVNGSPN